MAELQEALGRLGFDAGRVDGIFGPDTARALADFQRNVGLADDALCGPETVRALQRLRGRPVPGRGVSLVREYERLSRSERTLTGRRVVVGHLSDHDPGGFVRESVADTGARVPAGARASDATPITELCLTIGRAVRLLGSTVLTLDELDGTRQAAAANEFGADVYLGLVASNEATALAYYATSGFESLGGHRLADHLWQELTGTAAAPVRRPVGMRLPALRETRMPAVLVELSPDAVTRTDVAQVAAAVARSLARWVAAPVTLERH